MFKTRNERTTNLLKTLSAMVFLAVIFFGIAAEGTDKFDIMIGKSSESNDIDPMLVKAVISKESNFNPDARGKSGEIGLMQVRICAAADWAKALDKNVPSEEELSIPEINIEIGSWYLARAIKSWSDYKHSVVLALCEYNAGRRRALEWMPCRKSGQVSITIESTRAYVRDVISRYSEFASEGTALVYSR
ncbi:MAG: hypothetical protein A2020_01385 [Lentisphaerae bacterium GWF2_45_14]|nr:MAG: hypothetical protein A2020_01385 [Lentisphaerae bacterium GWF2_45_14]